MSAPDTASTFSTRTPGDLALNPLARALADRRAAGREILDLTESNPTRVGLLQPPSLLHALADPRSLLYDPSPLGLAGAREAIAREYARRGRTVDPGSVLVTASTSEAYSFLFKLLCDPGDAVAVPQPSYPLVDHLARLESVRTVPYTLEYGDRGWAIDRGSLRRALSPRTRIVLVVSPNNPTGSMLEAGDLTAIVEAAARRGAALVGDEVFADYVLDPSSRQPASVLDQAEVLAFALGGLSKSLGLPQLKMAWAVAAGPEPRRREAIERLEFVSDAFLSVATPVQLAAPMLFSEGSGLRLSIQERLLRNLRALKAAVSRSTAARVLDVEGGWSAVVCLPSGTDEDTFVLDLLSSRDVLVHPGYLFDFPHGAHVVVSLLPAPDIFDCGVKRLADRLGAR